MVAQKPVQYDELLVTVFICVIGGLLLIVGLGIYFENELTSLFFGGDASSAAKPASGADDANGRRASVPAADPSGAGGGGAADQSTNGGGAGFGSWGSPKRPGDRRVYSNGVRLEELLRWPALDACRALHAYAQEMSGEDTEAFFSALPQITNCVLGLDHANGALNKGWLNQQVLYTYPTPTLHLLYTYHLLYLLYLLHLPRQCSCSSRSAARSWRSSCRRRSSTCSPHSPPLLPPPPAPPSSRLSRKAARRAGTGPPGSNPASIPEPATEPEPEPEPQP